MLGILGFQNPSATSIGTVLKEDICSHIDNVFSVLKYAVIVFLDYLHHLWPSLLGPHPKGAHLV